MVKEAFTAAPLVASEAPARVQRQTLSGMIAMSVSGCVLLAISAMPWWASQGLIRSVVEISCYAAVAQMWNLLAGYAGLVSVGQQAFVGVAAYAMFVTCTTLGLQSISFGSALPVAPAILAVPTYGLLHRLDGPYFAIGTWVIAEVMRLATSTFGYVNAGAGMSLRVMTGYSAEQRSIGVSLSDGADASRDSRRKLPVAEVAIRPCARGVARQPGRGGQSRRECGPLALPRLD